MSLIIRSLICFIFTGISIASMADTLTHQLQSKLANHMLNFEVTLPSGYDPQQPNRYPVLYTGSGDRRLNLLRQQVDWLSHVNFAPLPPVILVTLPVIEPQGAMDKNAMAAGANLDLSIQVIATELIPFIDNTYKTQTYRIAEAFSSNANQLLSIFVERPETFNAYIVHSPALALDRTNIIDKLTQTKPRAEHAYRFLYVSLGSFPENKKPFDRLAYGLETWREHNIEGLEMMTDDLSRHNYLSGPIVGLVAAFEEMFKDRQPAPADFALSGIAGIQQHFEKVSKKYGYTMDADAVILDLAFFYAEQQLADKAIMTAQYLLNQQPKSLFLLTRLADIEKRVGKIEEAKSTLEKALVLAQDAGVQEPITYIKARLAEL